MIDLEDYLTDREIDSLYEVERVVGKPLYDRVWRWIINRNSRMSVGGTLQLMIVDELTDWYEAKGELRL